MKYKFVNHIPDCCSDADQVVIEFATFDELITKYENHFGTLDPMFRYVYAEYHGEMRLLMKLDKKGLKWWVLGYTDYPLENKLPDFQEEKRR